MNNFLIKNLTYFELIFVAFITVLATSILDGNWKASLACFYDLALLFWVSELSKMLHESYDDHRKTLDSYFEFINEVTE